MMAIQKYETQNGFAYRLVRFKLGKRVFKIVDKFTI
jgi:hypothetical protein